MTNDLIEFAADNNITIADEIRAQQIWDAASDDGYIQAADAVALFPGRPELHATLTLARALRSL